MATNGSFTQQDQYKSEHYPATAGHTIETSGAASNGSNNLEPSKDEVGWYFVEQYYTTLSRNPEKLHLFYGKRSQFVAGLETEISPVSVGRPAIEDRIKTLEFRDCKVRISNVDSQASDVNIVIQVIGEISNKSTDLKKFVQTFVLAKQPTGYFVLNDVFRYIKEDLDEEVQGTPGQEDADTTAGHEQLSEDVEMPKAQEPTEEHKVTRLDPVVVDKKLEEVLENPGLPAPTNGISTPVVEEAKEAPVAAVSDVAQDETTTAEEVEKVVEEESIKEPEAPKDPVPSPALTRLPSVAKPTTPAQPAAPAKPMSWASRAAAAVTTAPKPAVPVITKTASPAPAAVRAPPAQAAPPVQSTPAPANNKENESPQQSGWQSVGSEHAKRQNRPQSVSVSATPEKDNGTMAYLRNVTEAVETEKLRETLAAYGELVYFDINRQKNCAFVEFATSAGYQAAAAANPHLLGGEEIMVEPRRPKSSAYGGTGYNGARGGMNNRGRGGFENGRGGQRGRGDFGANRGRGAPRGRGGAPTTTA